MAFYNIMDRVPDADADADTDGELYGNEEYDALPKYPNDENYSDVTNKVM
jgi:hypothetical protein